MIKDLVSGVGEVGERSAQQRILKVWIDSASFNRPEPLCVQVPCRAGDVAHHGLGGAEPRAPAGRARAADRGGEAGDGLHHRAAGPVEDARVLRVIRSILRTQLRWLRTHVGTVF